MSEKKMCKICRQRPAVVPDRDAMSYRRSVCRECHADRLRGDLAYILKVEAERLKMERTPHPGMDDPDLDYGL